MASNFGQQNVPDHVSPLPGLAARSSTLFCSHACSVWYSSLSQMSWLRRSAVS